MRLGKFQARFGSDESEKSYGVLCISQVKWDFR